MNNPPVTPDRHALAEHYEASRKDVIDAGGRSRTLRGLALLVRQGMGAWMRAIGEDRGGPERPAELLEVSHLRLPVGMEQNLVTIVATMVLATALEGRA